MINNNTYFEVTLLNSTSNRFSKQARCGTFVYHAFNDSDKQHVISTPALAIPTSRFYFKELINETMENHQCTLNKGRHLFGLSSHTPLILTLRNVFVNNKINRIRDKKLQMATVLGYKHYTHEFFSSIVRLLKITLLPSEDIPIYKCLGSKKILTSNKEHDELFTTFVEHFNNENSELNESFQYNMLYNCQRYNMSDSLNKLKSHHQLVLDNKVSSVSLIGLFIGGIGYEETFSQRYNILHSFTLTSPETFVKFSTFQGSPIEIFQAIWCGVDVCEVWYPFTLAKRGLALVFSSQIQEMPYSDPDNDPDMQNIIDKVVKMLESDKIDTFTQLKLLNLKDYETYKNDLNPLTELSPCKESRSYLSHLFNTDEILGEIILAKHNWWMYEKLFSNIRFCLMDSLSLLAYYIYHFVSNEYIL